MRINEQGYLERRVIGVQGNPNSEGVYRNWWTVKALQKSNGTLYGLIGVHKIYLSQKYIGKKIRLKIEVIDHYDDGAIIKKMDCSRCGSRYPDITWNENFECSNCGTSIPTKNNPNAIKI